MNSTLSIEPKAGNVAIPDSVQRQRYLENEIHKISLKMMEADMVRNKYDLIHDMLTKEKMYYSRQQADLGKVSFDHFQFNFISIDSFRGEDGL